MRRHRIVPPFEIQADSQIGVATFSVRSGFLTLLSLISARSGQNPSWLRKINFPGA